MRKWVHTVLPKIGNRFVRDFLGIVAEYLVIFKSSWNIEDSLEALQKRKNQIFLISFSKGPNN